MADKVVISITPPIDVQIFLRSVRRKISTSMPGVTYHTEVRGISDRCHRNKKQLIECYTVMIVYSRFSKLFSLLKALRVVE